MSKDYNRNGLYVDTGLLRDHISKLREEKKLASRLFENIAFMKAFADSAVVHQYDLALRDIDRMIEYFDAMANLLAHVCDDATQISGELRGVIENSTDLSRRIVAESIML